FYSQIRFSVRVHRDRKDETRSRKLRSLYRNAQNGAFAYVRIRLEKTPYVAWSCEHGIRPIPSSLVAQRLVYRVSIRKPRRDNSPIEISRKGGRGRNTPRFE